MFETQATFQLVMSELKDDLYWKAVYMVFTTAVFHPEIAPYVVVADVGFVAQRSQADLKPLLEMAVTAEAPRTARSRRPAPRPTARRDHRSELLLPQSGCASDLATNPRRAHMRDKIVSATLVAIANVKSALHFLATLHVYRRTCSVA